MNAFDVEKIATKIKANIQGQTEPETRQIIDEREITLQVDVGYYIKDNGTGPNVLEIMDNVFDDEGNPITLYNRCPANLLTWAPLYKQKYGKYPDGNVSVTRYEKNSIGEWIPQVVAQGNLDVRYMDENDTAIETIKEAIQDAYMNSDAPTTTINLAKTYKVVNDDDLITYKATMQSKYTYEKETKVRQGYFIMQNKPFDEQSTLDLKDSDTIKFEDEFIFGFFPYYGEEPSTSIYYTDWKDNGGYFGTAKLKHSRGEEGKFNQIELTFVKNKEGRKGMSTVFDQAVWIKGHSTTSGFSEVSAHTEIDIARSTDISSETEKNPTLTETIRKILFGININTNVNNFDKDNVAANEGMSMEMHLSRFKEETDFVATDPDQIGSDAVFKVKDNTTRTISEFFGKHLTGGALTREKMYLDPALKLPEIE